MIRYCIRHRKIHIRIFTTFQIDISISMEVVQLVSIHGVINVGWGNLFVAMLLVMMVVFSSLLFLVEWLEDENYYVETFFLFISFLKKIWVFVFTKFVSLTIFICRWLNTYNFESYRKVLLIYICIYSVTKLW